MWTDTYPARRVLLSGLALSVVLAAAACDSAQGPGLSGPQFSTQVGISGFQQRLDSAPARVRITLADTGLVATRVNIHRPDQLDRPERIEGRVTAISVGGADSSITLDLGGLVIGFNGATRFGAADEGDEHAGDEQDSVRDSLEGSDGRDGFWDHEGDHGPLTVGQFVASVQAALAAGGRLPQRDDGRMPAGPQAPDDATFLAQRLRLDHEADHPRIELNVSGANFQTNASPPPDGWLQVLGLKIALDVTGGITHLEVATPETEGEAHFRGIVQSVDQGANTVTLTDSSVVRIVAGTRFESADDRDEADSTALATLADVQAALTAGKSVVCRGEGVLDTATPRVWDAVEVEFRLARS